MSNNFSIVSGNSTDLEVNFCESEIKADVVVSEHNSVRLWGRIVNCDNEPISNALIKLLRIEYCGDIANYEGVAHTISDSDGFYQFEIFSGDRENTYYKLIVSKVAYAPERMIPISEENCGLLK